MSISKDFVLAGEAIFTIEVPPDSKHHHHTFKVQFVEGSEKFKPTYFVRMLVGPNNNEDYCYLGILDEFTGQVRTTAKSLKFKDCFPLKLLNRTLARVWSNDHEAYEKFGYKTHHEGRCGRCGRRLTVPESVESGIGPECRKKIAFAS